MREVRCKNLRFFFNFVEITNYRTQYLNTLVCPHSKKSKNASFSGQKLHFTDKINHKVPLEFLGFFSAYGMRLMETVSIRLIKEVGTLRVDFLFLFVNQGFF